MTTQEQKVLEIKEVVEPNILSIPGVAGIGIGKASPAHIRVYAKYDCPLILNKIPAEIGGVPVKVIVTGGDFVALQSLQALAINPRTKARPAFPGMSIGHPLIGAGTFGNVCYDNVTGEPMILSNTHVIANSTSIQTERAFVGDDIYQPGVADGGTFADKIGTLHRIIPFDEIGINEVDCSLARPLNPADISDEILDIGRVKDIAEPKIGSAVIKSGRTTGYTESRVEDVNATAQIDYAPGFRAYFRNQIIITNPQSSFVAAGDSGSLLVDKITRRATGLIYAGSPNLAIANRMTLVANALDINLGGNTYTSGDELTPGQFWGTMATMSLPIALWMKRNKKNKGGR